MNSGLLPLDISQPSMRKEREILQILVETVSSGYRNQVI